jgi:hypothetical protein
VRNEIKRNQVSHKEARERRQLAQIGRQPFEQIVADLEHRTRSDHDHSIRISHVEPFELSQLADFYRQRREPVVVRLKGRGVVRSRSICHQCRTESVLRLVSRPSSRGRDVSWLP